MSAYSERSRHILQPRRENPGDGIEIRRSAVHGKGIFATRAFAEGELLTVLTGPLIRGAFAREVGPNWVGIGPQAWIDPDAHIEHLNHCCDPNAAFGRKRHLIAIRDIEPGQEILIDYSTTESDPNWFMDCSCGLATCRRRIFAIQYDFLSYPAAPPASPLMRLVWAKRKEGLERSPAFPQIGPQQRTPAGTRHGSVKTVASRSRRKISG